MATITGNAAITYGLQEKISTGYLSPINLPLAISSAANYNTSGTGAGQLDTGFGKPIVLVASTPQTFDLTNITDQAGNTLNFARVRELVIQNLDTTAAHIVHVYSGASNGWSFLPPVANQLTVTANGGVVLLRDINSSGAGVGMVVGSTSKTFTLDPGSNNVTVNLLILGTSVA